MPTLPFIWLDVFTQTRFAGNPLAVVKIPPHHEISTAQMQTLAFEFNLSETVFIYERQPTTGKNNNTNDHEETAPEWRMRIFFPTKELPFAGHPTIGAACYALGTLAPGASKGKLICNAGPIELDYSAGVAKAVIPQNFHRHVQVPFTLEQVSELQPSLREGERIVPKAIDVVSPVKGMDFVCVELADLETLAKMRTSAVIPQPTLDEGWGGGFAGSYFYVVTSREKEEREGGSQRWKATLRTRMIEGALEDPATGSAACGLGMFLALKWGDCAASEFEIVQGVEMGRRSEIGVGVGLREGLREVEGVQLGGCAVKVMEGVVEY